MLAATFCAAGRARVRWSGAAGFVAGRVGAWRCVLARAASATCAGCCRESGSGRSRCAPRYRRRSPRRPCSRCGSRCGAATGRWRRRLPSSRCGCVGSHSPRTGSSARCCASCAATCARSAPQAAAAPVARRGRGSRRAAGRARRAWLPWAALARGGGDLRVHTAPPPRPVRRGAAAAGRRRGSPTGSGRTPTSAGPTGPGQPLLLTLASEAFEPSCCGGGSCAWRPTPRSPCSPLPLVRDAAPARAGRWRHGAAAPLTMAQPTLANPFPVALAFALGALARRGERPGDPRRGARGRGGGLAARLRAFAALAALVDGRSRRPAPSRARSRPVAPRRWRPGPDGVLYAAVRGRRRARRPVGGAGRRARPTTARAWRLPFPLIYDGPLRAARAPARATSRTCSDSRAAADRACSGSRRAAAVAVRAIRERRADRVAAGLGVLALGGLAYLLSRADELHQQPLLGRGLRARRRAGARGAPRAARAIALAVVLALIVARRRGEPRLERAPPAGRRAVHLPGVPGILVAPGEARALPALVRDVQRPCRPASRSTSPPGARTS